MEFKIGDKFTFGTFGVVEIVKLTDILDVFVVRDLKGNEWYIAEEFLKPFKEPTFSSCTCGAHSLGHPGHSTWCDSLNEVA